MKNCIKIANTAVRETVSRLSFRNKTSLQMGYRFFVEKYKQNAVYLIREAETR